MGKVISRHEVALFRVYTDRGGEGGGEQQRWSVACRHRLPQAHAVCQWHPVLARCRSEETAAKKGAEGPLHKKGPLRTCTHGDRGLLSVTTGHELPMVDTVGMW